MLGYLSPFFKSQCALMRYVYKITDSPLLDVPWMFHLMLTIIHVVVVEMRKLSYARRNAIHVDSIN